MNTIAAARKSLFALVTQSEVRMQEEPASIIGRALASWHNPPAPLESTDDIRAKAFQEFIETVCQCHNLVILPLGVVEEIKKD